MITHFYYLNILQNFKYTTAFLTIYVWYHIVIIITNYYYYYLPVFFLSNKGVANSIYQKLFILL